jgi:hypothetical protein
MIPLVWNVQNKESRLVVGCQELRKREDEEWLLYEADVLKLVAIDCHCMTVNVF